MKPQELGSRVWADEFSWEQDEIPGAQTDLALQEGVGSGVAGEAARVPDRQWLGAGSGAVELAWSDVQDLEARLTAAIGERVDEAAAATARALADSLGRGLSRLASSAEQGVHRAFREDSARLAEQLRGEGLDLRERLTNVESALEGLTSARLQTEITLPEQLEKALSTFGEASDELRLQMAASFDELRTGMADIPTREQLEESLGRIPSLEGVEGRLDRLAQQGSTEADAAREGMGRLEASVGDRVARFATELEETRSALLRRIEETLGQVATRDQLEERLAAMDSRLTEIDRSGATAIEGHVGALREEVDRLLRELAAKLEESFSTKMPSLEGVEARLDQLAQQAFTEAEAAREGMGRLEASVGEQVARLATHLDETRSALPTRMAEALGPLSGRVDELSADIETLSAAVPEQGRDVQAQLRQLATSVHTEIEQAAAAQSSAVTDLDRRLRDAGDRLGELIATLASAVPERESTERALADMRDRLEALATTVAGLGSTADLEAAVLERMPDRERIENGLVRLGALMRRLHESVVATPMPDVTAVERSLGERLQAVELALVERLDAARGEISDSVSSQTAAVARVAESAADTAETVRKQLVEALGQGKQGAADLNERVTAAVAASLAALERDVTHRVEALVRGEVSEALSAAVDGFRGDLRAAMAGRADARDLHDAVRVQEKFEEATARMREDLERLSKVVSSFGQPRMAPRLAQDLRALERRLDRAEHGLTEELAAMLESRIRPLEERMAAVVQRVRDEVRALDGEAIARALSALEGRVREAVGEAEGDDRKRRFRRRP